MIEPYQQVQTGILNLLHNGVGLPPVVLPFFVRFNIAPGKILLYPAKAHFVNELQIAYCQVWTPPHEGLHAVLG